MPDREKVIRGLESHGAGESLWIICHNCPYCKEDISMDRTNNECVSDLMRDALLLLKEQEEKRTPKPIIHGYKEEYWGEEEICPDCGKKWQSEIIDTTHFCPGCGRSVKWYD